MLLRASLIDDIRRLRVAVWLLLVLVLISSLIWAWRNLLPKANQSAFLLASQTMVERANYYKQQWLLSQKPTQLTIEGIQLNYTDNGWVKPVDVNQQTNCRVWLDILYPQSEVLGLNPIAIKNQTIQTAYRCDYFYQYNQLISISLIDGKFVVMQKSE